MRTAAQIRHAGQRIAAQFNAVAISALLAPTSGRAAGSQPSPRRPTRLTYVKLGLFKASRPDHDAHLVVIDDQRPLPPASQDPLLQVGTAYRKVRRIRAAAPHSACAECEILTNSRPALRWRPDDDTLPPAMARSTRSEQSRVSGSDDGSQVYMRQPTLFDASSGVSAAWTITARSGALASSNACRSTHTIVHLRDNRAEPGGCLWLGRRRGESPPRGIRPTQPGSPRQPRQPRT